LSCPKRGQSGTPWHSGTPSTDATGVTIHLARPDAEFLDKLLDQMWVE
jgi:hypothetical protein